MRKTCTKRQCNDHRQKVTKMFHMGPPTHFGVPLPVGIRIPWGSPDESRKLTVKQVHCYHGGGDIRCSVPQNHLDTRAAKDSRKKARVSHGGGWNWNNV